MARSTLTMTQLMAAASTGTYEMAAAAVDTAQQLADLAVSGSVVNRRWLERTRRLVRAIEGRGLVVRHSLVNGATMVGRAADFEPVKR